MLRIHIAALAAVIGVTGTLQAQGTGRLHGTVFDSLSSKPLVGAEVQALRTDGTATGRYATSDAAGNFVVSDLVPGTYAVGFFHPGLDSLGLGVAPRSISVTAGADVRADLAIPSHRSVIATLCPSGTADSSALVIGFVRDAASGNAAGGATAILEWGEWAIAGGALHEERQTLTAKTRADGWYAFCNVPVTWVMQLRAARGADTSGAIDPKLVAQQVAIRDLYVGPTSRAVVERELPQQKERFVPETEVVWTGSARLAGIIRGVDGAPIPGARVTISGTNAIASVSSNGTFVLRDLPSGSQTLEARAIGYIPNRIAVHLVPDSTMMAPPLALTRMKAFLDTVRVTATRIYSADVSGFEARKRAHVGHFVDRAKIDRDKPFFASDLMRMLPGVEVAPAGVGYFGRMIYMRQAFRAGVCSPTLWVDGMMYTPGEVQLDDLLPPDQIEGIEVYTRQSQAPAQYTNTMSGCGSIVVWTRKTSATPARK